MGYCTLEDIKNMLPNVPITETSKPSADDVGGVAADPGPPPVEAQPGYIDYITAEMDAVMESVGIVTPPTDADKLTYLSGIAGNGVCAMVLRAAAMEPEQAKAFEDMYRDALRAIEKNPALIMVTSGTGRSGAIGGRVSIEDRPWRREEDDW